MGRKSDSDDSFTQLPGNSGSITLSNEQFALLILTKAKLGVTDKATSIKQEVEDSVLTLPPGILVHGNARRDSEILACHVLIYSTQHGSDPSK